MLDGARAFVAIGGVSLFWVITSWPNGASAIFFVMTVVLLLGPRGDAAYGGAIAAALGITGSIVCAAITKFAMLPAFETFPGFCVILGSFLIPVGFAMVRSRQPAVVMIFTTILSAYFPLLAPTNEMSYDTAQFYNSALAANVGTGIAALAFALLPPLSPALRARRLLALTLRDLRRVADSRWLPTFAGWEGRIFARLAALPDQTEPLQRARLLAALSVGTELLQLRDLEAGLGSVALQLEGAFDALAQGNSAAAISRLRLIDGYLAPELRPSTANVLRARGNILLMCEALSEHAPYFDEEKTHASR